MNVYILDGTQKLVTVMKEHDVNSDNTGIKDENMVYYTFTQTEEADLLSSVSLTAPSNFKDSPYLVEGNYIVFRDYDLIWQMYEINAVTDNHDITDGSVREVYAEHIILETIDDVITDLSVVTSSASSAMLKALMGSDWEIKIIEPTIDATCSFYYISRLEAIQKVREVYGGHLKFEVVLSGGVITHKYVSLLNRLGQNTGKQFTFDKDLISVKRVSDTKNLITAVYGRGKGVEVGGEGDATYGRRLDLSAVVWAKPTAPADKPLYQLYIEDTNAKVLWGRKGGTQNKFGIFIDDTITNADTLAIATWSYLQQNNTPMVTYDCTALDLERLTAYSHEAIRLGDTILIFDKEFTPTLQLNADIIKIVRDYVNPDANAITMGNYRESFYNKDLQQNNSIKDLLAKAGVYDKVGTILNENGNIPTSMLEGIISTLQNEINASGGLVTITEANGIMITDSLSSPTKAMKLSGMGLAIANTKNPDTTWNWRTFGTGDGFTADLIIAGVLLGNKAKFDLTNGVLRLGNSDTDYKFLFDGTNLHIGSGLAIGSPTITGGTIVGARLQEVNGAKILTDIYKNTLGGLITVNDINGAMNATLGSESKVGANIGGTLQLYDDSASKLRVKLGITAGQHAGYLTLDDSAGVMRYQASAYGPSGMPLSVCCDATGAVTSWMSDAGFGGLGRGYATKWTGTIGSGNMQQIMHGLGYFPIVIIGMLSTSGPDGTQNIKFQYNDANTITVSSVAGAAGVMVLCF